MEHPHIQLLQTFTLEDIPTLDTVVLGALELFSEVQVPAIDTTMYKHPLVVGSGNAEATGRIVFGSSDAVFASESTYEHKLTTIPTIDGVVALSASGGKHAPSIVKRAKELGKPVTLLTNKEGSPAGELLHIGQGDQIYIFPKNREPYTYNTSTYMGMILGATGEDAHLIKTFINDVIDQIDFSKLASYDKFYLIIPPEFSECTRMLSIKFIELFGRNVAYDVETSEYVRHATTIVPSHELFISFGYDNQMWGDSASRLNIPLPTGTNYGAMMAIAYYVIGKIQASHPPYFKDNIVEYTKTISTMFGETITPIV